MTQLPEPNFIERDADKITQEWITLYEEKSGKTLQPAQIERLMIDIGAYRENILRIKIQETAKQNLLSYADLDMLQHIGEPLGVSQLKADSATVILKFSLDEALDFDYAIPQGTELETKDGLFIFETINAA
ncbi:MAG: baseplate J/gp47 family protein, partial [bacterium]